MRWEGGGRLVPLVAAAVTLLLTAGVVSATTHQQGPATTVAADGRVGSVGLGQADVLDEEALPRPAVVIPAPDPSRAPSATPRTVPSVPWATVSTKAPTTTTTSPVNPGPATTLSTVPARTSPPTSSWQATGDGVSAKMRLEPATPTAGQPVRIHLDVSGVLACCYVFLHFGDGSEKFALNTDWMCQGVSPLSPGLHSTVVTHTYARAGVYRAWLQVLDGDLCTLPPVHPPDTPVPLHNLDIHACIVVGPGTAGDGGCPPLPPFRPFPTLH